MLRAHKENKHERGRTKNLPEAQLTKEAPCYEEVCSGKETDSPRKAGNGKRGSYLAEAPPIVLARARRVEATYCSSFILVLHRMVRCSSPRL